MITFACILFSGSDQVPDYSTGYYSELWVERLFHGLAKHIPDHIQWELLVLTDGKPWRFPIQPEIRHEHLQHPPGWFSLLEPLRDAAATGRRVITLGLDSVITGSLAQLCAYTGEFGWLRDPYNRALCCNGISSCSAEMAARLWGRFIADPDGARRSSGFAPAGGLPSEMVWLRNQLGCNSDLLDDLHPGRYVSYKCHMAGRDGVVAARILDASSVVYFHGRPRQSDLAASDPVRMLWEGCA